jgi:hypothetical protein
MGCDEIAQPKDGAMARLSQGLGETLAPEPDAATSLNSFAATAIACARLGAFIERCMMMMRPDHIFFAMTILKHSTLAGAAIFAFKILRFAVKTL